MPLMMNKQQVLASADHTLKTELAGLQALGAALSGELAEAFWIAIETIAASKGRIIVTGVGKSGHIGSKIAATFASTGTPAFFVHPAEANHGDLGMIARDDVILAISWSGESSELRGIFAYSRRFSIPIIAITSVASSTVGKEANIALVIPKQKEACPNGIAPTTSTLMQMAIGDALAIALLEGKGFSENDFRTFHPGGQLGAMLTHIGDVMHKGNAVPLLQSGTKMRHAILTITEKGFGCAGVVNDHGTLIGIITDGDLRRNIDKDMLMMTVDQVMTHNPKTVAPDMLTSAAMAIINEGNITALLVVEDKRVVGIVHVHDLLRIGVA